MLRAVELSTFVNSDEVEFWEERYRADRMPWDFHGVPDALTQYLRQTSAKGRVLVPGCGSGYDVRAFYEQGWQPTAIDFSPAAIERAQTFLGPQADALRLADFFRDEFGSGFDLIYERTFLCSLPPGRWPEYARRMAELLKPGGKLVGIFMYGDEPEPPPFPLTEPAAQSLFAPYFNLTEDRRIPAAQSLPLYAGKERWQIWTRR
jgi:SAM-dependent methyltransferase